jgi:hypothetical protein
MVLTENRNSSKQRRSLNDSSCTNLPSWISRIDNHQGPNINAFRPSIFKLLLKIRDLQTPPGFFIKVIGNLKENALDLGVADTKYGAILKFFSPANQSTYKSSTMKSYGG